MISKELLGATYNCAVRGFKSSKLQGAVQMEGALFGIKVYYQCLAQKKRNQIYICCFRN